MNLGIKRNNVNLKKLIKGDSEIGKRLQSVRLPPDLSLGGPKLPKRQFAPNLNATRNKDKPKEILKKNEHKHKERNNDRKPIKFKEQNIIQSSGIFSEGAGGDIIRTSRWTRGDNDGSSGLPSMTMPTFKKHSYQIDKRTEDNVLDDIIGCDEDSKDEKLPFHPVPWQTKQIMPVKQEIKKEEHFDFSNVMQDFNSVKLECSDYQMDDHKEYLGANSASNDNPSMALWRLPDSFSGKGLSDDPNCKTLFDYGLNDMIEGKIGKLLIRKSGKVEVQIGRIKYHLEPSDVDIYREEVVSVEADSKNQMVAAVLGQIQNRYSLYPDWETLMK
nr:DNA-directed RNA polymerase III subunit RPC4-like [Leptinotarsa decemlineata]